MKTMFIIHKPGMVPRIGYPTGDEATSLRDWQKHNPGAAIYVLQAQDLPPPGTASAQTVEEFLAIDDATKCLPPSVTKPKKAICKNPRDCQTAMYCVHGCE